LTALYLYCEADFFAPRRIADDGSPGPDQALTAGAPRELPVSSVAGDILLTRGHLDCAADDPCRRLCAAASRRRLADCGAASRLRR